LGADSTLNVTGTGVLSLNGAITGTNNLTKDGAGTVQLGADSSATFTGNWNLNFGTLDIDSDLRLGNAANDLAL
jgi:autotransporter-associated beta strand protein